MKTKVYDVHLLSGERVAVNATNAQFAVNYVDFFDEHGIVARFSWPSLAGVVRRASE